MAARASLAVEASDSSDSNSVYVSLRERASVSAACLPVLPASPSLPPVVGLASPPRDVRVTAAALVSPLHTGHGARDGQQGRPCRPTGLATVSRKIARLNIIGRGPRSPGHWLAVSTLKILRAFERK